MSGAGTIAFSHANGFPAGTYRLLFEAWREAGFRVITVPKFGHHAAYPVSNNWPHLRDELIACIEAQAAGQKVHLVGHSLGGYMGLLAACRRPDLARSVVLLDSPLFTGWRARSVHVVKLCGLMRRISPGRVSRTRRQQWPSAEEAHRHFAAKPVFARWAPQVLHDYIDCGIEPAEPGDSGNSGNSGGVRLAFRREIETRIYNTLPHHLGRLLRRHPPQCPISFVGGTRSAEVRWAGMAATRAIAQFTQGRIEWLEGSHLFPMEQPAAAAQAVLRALALAQAQAGHPPA